jgi:hypothetical protein
MPVLTPASQTPDSHHLTVAQGWLELGNYLEANEELGTIAPENRGVPAILEVRWPITERRRIDRRGCLTLAAVSARPTGQNNMTVALTLRSLSRAGSMQHQLPLDWG